MKLSDTDLVFVPLGGCQEFGINLNAYGYGGKWLVVDCGIGFADERYPGVDILLPDPTFLEERRDDLLGILVTHVHEDHIGAIPYLWSRLKCPIYCVPFAASFLRRKCAEFGDVKGMVIHEIHPDQILDLGPFKTTVVGVTHSTPDTVSFIFDTPAGRVVHGNEWNLDPTPGTGVPTNREAFKAVGRKGVLAYIGDSTNAPYSGQSMGERVVQQGLERVFSECHGKIAITIFASNVGRILSIAKAAAASGRHIAVAGRSLYNMIAAAGELGYLKGYPPFLDLNEAAALPRNKVVYIVTGSQGEPRAALARIARNDYRGVEIGAGDTAIFSSRAIPGNEREISRIKGDLIGRGVQVVDDDNTVEIIHVSGHPYREEIAEMLDWVRPKIVVPIHGERVHLEAQAEIARGKQIPHVIVPDNGSVVILNAERPHIVGEVPTGILAVEPARIVTTDHVAIAERRKLQESGALHVSLAIGRDGALRGTLQVTGVGLFDYNDADDMDVIKQIIADLRTCVANGDPQNLNALAEDLRLAARRVVHTSLGLKPRVTVHILQV